jgi:uncharacterized membrane protein
MNLRPGFFAAEDQIKHEEISRKMKFTVFFVLIGFVATTAFRTW